MAKDFDIIEQRALATIAAKLPSDTFNFPTDEVPAFLQWLVHEFGEEIRKEVESGRAPF